MVQRGLNRRQVLNGLGLGALCVLAARDAPATPDARAVRRRKPLLIRGGTVVNASGSARADVLVEGDKITAVGVDLRPARGARIIDASGLSVMPGGIDPHVHLTPPFVDDFTVGSQAAFAGAVTSVGAMVSGEANESTASMIERYTREVAAKSAVDVFLHPVVNPPPKVEFLEAVAAAGQRSFKMFTLDVNFDRDFALYASTLQRAKELGLLPMFHCEDMAVMNEARRRLVAAGKTSIAHYEESRPQLAEVLAVGKVIALAELTDCPVYLVHISTARALRICEEARSRGVQVYVETRPIYLYLTAESYRAADGPLYVGMPPLRSAQDREALWEALRNGSVATLGSDHAPWLRQQKMDPKHDITDPLAGMSDLEFTLPMLYSEGVLKGSLRPERFVEVTSTNAAKLFGLYPQKGVIQSGADADIVLWDPALRRIVHAGDNYSRADFSLFEGRELSGGPRLTLRRGEIVAQNGKVSAAPGSGNLLGGHARSDG